MQKKTAKQATERRTDSPAKKSGLIAKGKNSKRSARTKSVLDNRSHRTDMRLSCGRPLTGHSELSRIIDLTIRSNQSNRDRPPASAAC
jgi:hypothetical protein